MAIRKTLNVGKTRITAYRLDHVQPLCEAVVESRAELARWLPWCHDNYGLDDATAFVERSINGWAEGSMYQVAIEDASTGELVGSGGLERINSINRFAEIGYWIRSSATGQGHATRATRLLTELGLEDAQLWRVEILIAAGNHASLRVAQKAGAVLEGRLRNRLLLYGQSVDADLLSIVRKAGTSKG